MELSFPVLPRLTFTSVFSLQAACRYFTKLAYSSSHFTPPLNTVLDRLFSLQRVSGIDLAVGSGFSWCSNWSSVLHSMFLLMVWCSREKIGQREREHVCVCTQRHKPQAREGLSWGDVLCFSKASPDTCASLAASALDIQGSSLLSQGSSKYSKSIVIDFWQSSFLRLIWSTCPGSV